MSWSRTRSTVAETNGRLDALIARWVRLAVLAAALAGCTSTHHGGAPATTSTAPTASATTSTSASTTTSGPARTTTTARGAGCTLDELNVTSPGTQGAAGHQAAVIVFENRGSRTCVLTGYPGVAALDQSGHQVAQAERTPTGSIGGLSSAGEALPVVTVAPAGKASATVEGTSVPVGGASGCPTYSALEVTAPGETRSARLDVGLPGCSPLQVHPVVAGTTGSERH